MQVENIQHRAGTSLESQKMSLLSEANAQREKLQDLRECKMEGVERRSHLPRLSGTDAADKDIAGGFLRKLRVF